MMLQKKKIKSCCINVMLLTSSIFISYNVNAGSPGFELYNNGVKIAVRLINNHCESRVGLWSKKGTRTMHTTKNLHTSEFELLSKKNVRRNLLIVNASPNLENSNSRALSHHFVRQLESHYPSQHALIYRDLEKEPIPYIRSNTLEVITSGITTTTESKSLMDLSDILIREVEHSDAIVIATPMHNFTIPAPLKSYFDLVLRAGKTFRYTSNGPVGMLADRPMLLISTSGGCYYETESDFLTPYMKRVFNFIGINNFTSVVAEGLATGDKMETSLANAREKLEKQAKFFYKSDKIKDRVVE